MDSNKEPLHASSDEEEARLKKMARMNLTPTRLLGPPGWRLYDPKYIFIILAAHSGIIVMENYGPEDDKRWITMLAAGLPDDMRRMDIVFSAAAYHERYKDFAIHIRGVEVDEKDATRGKGAWLYTLKHDESGEQIRIHVWFTDIFLRNSQAHLIAHYTDPNKAESRYKQLTLREGGVAVELMDHDPHDHKSSIRLIENDVLLSNMQVILDAAVSAKRGGSQARMPLSKDTIKKYHPAYGKANALLRDVLNARRYKIISKYSPVDRLDILKHAFPEQLPEIIENLANYNTRHEIALQLAMFEAGEIPIGTWQKDRLIDFLNKSKELNGIKN